MAMIPVAEALSRILGSIPAPVSAEAVALDQAAGRTLAADVAALRTQPPFAASAMDGYAVRAADAAGVPASLDVIGASAAGHGFPGPVGPARPCGSSPVRRCPRAPMPW
jgi:molybdopterin molybdotransferase